MDSASMDFLYLSQSDVLQAGAGDRHRCAQIMEEVFHLVASGDYVMGGSNGNSHGLQMLFPDSSAFSRMPHSGPDRRFFSMIAYLGGRFHVAGNKWYGSNRHNLEKGLPRSIHMITLSDIDTGAPLAHLSGNAISSARTGAVGAVGARYLARQDVRTIGIVGAGVIGTSCLLSLLANLPQIDQVYIYDLNAGQAQLLVDRVRRTYPVVRVELSTNLRKAVEFADVVNVATSGTQTPQIEARWVKPGALLLLPGNVVLPTPLIKRARKVVDNWQMFELWREELSGYPGGYRANLGSLAAHFLELIDSGELSPTDLTNFGDVLAEKVAGRQRDDETILFVQGGMPVEDIGWAFEIYQDAQKMGLGTSLNLWDHPADP